jgi:hypothetical protein
MIEEIKIKLKHVLITYEDIFKGSRQKVNIMTKKTLMMSANWDETCGVK